MKIFPFSQMKIKVAIPLLLITTFSWWTTFTIVKEAVALIDVYLFLTQRFCLAFLLLAIFCLIGRRPLSRSPTCQTARTLQNTTSRSSVL